MKGKLSRLRIVFLAILLILCFYIVAVFTGVIIASCSANVPPEFYKSTDIEDYGNYTGNYDNHFPSEFINSFFPESIDSSLFEVVEYSYYANKFDTYGFEAYLELRIINETAFNSYVSEIAEEHEWKIFDYDSRFKEYSIENVFRLGRGESNDYYPIEQAKIRKVLCCFETQTIIFVAIGVYDGGGTGTDELNVFFDRFGIDPALYANTVDSSFADPYEIATKTRSDTLS